MFKKLKEIKQIMKQGFKDSDCWSIDYFMQTTFSKMLLRLREFKHGHPAFITFDEIKYFPIEFVKESMDILEKENNKLKESEQYDIDLFDSFCLWQIIIMRIAYCFKMTNDEEYENEYSDEYFDQVFGENGFEFEELDNNLNRLITYEPDEELKIKYDKRNDEIYKEIDEMKEEAFALLSKYYFHLWD